MHVRQSSGSRVFSFVTSYLNKVSYLLFCYASNKTVVALICLKTTYMDVFEYTVL